MPKNEEASSGANIAKSYNDFLVLPILLPSTSIKIFKEEDSAPIHHYLYVRPHNPEHTAALNASSDINDRSLYAVNVPTDSTTQHFRSYFSSIGGGRIETVIFEDEPLPFTQQVTAHDKSKKRKRNQQGQLDEKMPLPATWDRKLHKSGCTAVLVFVDKESMDITLRAIKRQHSGKAVKDAVWGKDVGDSVPLLGIERYRAHERLKCPSREMLQKIVDQSFMAYDARLEAEMDARRKTANQPDEDGFVTVVRSSKPKPILSAEEIAEQKAELKKKAEKGLYQDFYRFQQRQVKKEQAQQLLKKFEDDKRKLQELQHKSRR